MQRYGIGANSVPSVSLWHSLRALGTAQWHIPCLTPTVFSRSSRLAGGGSFRSRADLARSVGSIGRGGEWFARGGDAVAGVVRTALRARTCWFCALIGFCAEQKAVAGWDYLPHGGSAEAPISRRVSTVASDPALFGGGTDGLHRAQNKLVSLSPQKSSDPA